jgi:hypothetical protein
MTETSDNKITKTAVATAAGTASTAVLTTNYANGGDVGVVRLALTVATTLDSWGAAGTG